MCTVAYALLQHVYEGVWFIQLVNCQPLGCESIELVAFACACYIYSCGFTFAPVVDFSLLTASWFQGT